MRSRASVAGDADATLVFRNDASVAGEVFWVDFLGTEVSRGHVAPGAELTVQSFRGHVWVVREPESRRRLRTWQASDRHAVVPIHTHDLRSFGGESVDVAIKNLYTRTVSMSWRDPNGELRPLGRLAPSKTLTLSARAGDVLEYAEDGEAIGVLLLGVEQQQFRTIRSGPSRRPTGVLSITNSTPLRVGLHLRTGQKGVRFHRLEPGERVQQPVVAGEQWTARDQMSRRVIQQIIAPDGDGQVSITSAHLRSRRTKEPADVTLVNRSSLVGRVLLVDQDGVEHDRGLIPPGRRRKVNSARGEVWRVREETTGKEIGLHCTSAVPETRSRIQVRSIHSRTPATLTVRNQTLLTADVMWIDGQGRERPKGVLAAWGQLTFDTHLTHAWVLRERHTRQALDFAVVDQLSQTVLLDRVDLRRVERPDETVMEFVNDTGFPVEVVPLADPTGEAVAHLATGGSAQVHGPARRAFGFREPISRSLFGAALATEAESQTHHVDLEATVCDGSTTLTIFNPTPAEIDLTRVDESGEHPAGSIESWETFVAETSPGEVWVARERRSGTVLACTTATTTRRTLNIDLTRLRTVEKDQGISFTLVNESGMDVNVVGIEPDGSLARFGILAHGQTSPHACYATQVVKMLEPATGALVDFAIVRNRRGDRAVVRNNIVNHTIPVGGLRRGEIAFYPDPHFGGTPAIVNEAISDLRAVGAASSSSIRLGPSTGITAYRDTEFGGPSRVFHIDTAALDGAELADGFLSFEVFTVSPPDRHVTRVSSDLAAEYRPAADGTTVSRSVYQTVLTFPPEVSAVSIGATAEVAVEHGERTHTIDSDSWMTVTPNSAGIVKLSTPADRLGSPALMVRTDAMRTDERFFVFPDVAVMRRIASLPDDALWDAANRPPPTGGAGSGRTLDLKPAVRQDPERGKAACAQVQAAIQQLAKSVPGETSVGSTPRSASATEMDYDAWSFGSEADEPKFAPLSPDQAAVVPVGENDDIGLLFGPPGRPIRFDARPFVDLGAAARQLATTIDRATKELERGLEEVNDKVLQPALKELNDKVLEPAAAALNEGLEDIRQGLDDAGDVLGAAVDAALDAALDVVVHIGVAVTGRSEDEVRTVVLDTVEKVGEVITNVVNAVVEGVSSVLEFLESLLDWDAIKDTQRLLVELVDDALKKASSYVEPIRNQLASSADLLGRTIHTGLDQLRDQLGAIKPLERSAEGGPRTDEPAAGLDQFLAPIIDFFDGDGGDAGQQVDVTLQAMLETVVRSVGETTGVLSEMLDSIGNSVGSGIDGVFAAPVEQVLPRLAGVLIQIIEDIAAGFIELTTSLGDVVVAVLAALLDAVRTALTDPLPEIPLISPLYRAQFGSEPTPLGLMSFVVAVPSSIVGRSLFGDEWPPTGIDLNTQLRDTIDKVMTVLDIGVHVVRLFLDPWFILKSKAGSVSYLGDVMFLFLDLLTMVLDFPGYRIVPSLLAGVKNDLAPGVEQTLIVSYVFGVVAWAWRQLVLFLGRNDRGADSRAVESVAVFYDLFGTFLGCIGGARQARLQSTPSNHAASAAAHLMLLFDLAGILHCLDDTRGRSRQPPPVMSRTAPRPSCLSCRVEWRWRRRVGQGLTSDRRGAPRHTD